MTRPPTKLADIYATPKTELVEDDLSFLRGMIDKPVVESDPIDYSFLRNELAKRRPAPHVPKKGIEMIEPQTKPATRGPKYIKSRVVSRQAQYTFDDLPFEVTSQYSRSETMSRDQDVAEVPLPTSSPTDEVSNTSSPSKARKPKSYVAWKYIGETDGVLGCLTGKVDAAETPTTLSRELANIPYELERYKVDRGQPEQPQPKVRPRDLFAMSIKNGTREYIKRETISRMKKSQRRGNQEEQDTMLFLETDTKLVPLQASRLKKSLV